MISVVRTTDHIFYELLIVVILKHGCEILSETANHILIASYWKESLHETDMSPAGWNDDGNVF